MTICAIYKKNPSRTVDATERTRFFKSRSNDLEDIGQGQGSSHATHPLILLIICTKYGKNPSWTVDATGRTRKVNGQTDGQTGLIQYNPPPPPPPPPSPPPNFVVGVLKSKRSTYQQKARYSEPQQFLVWWAWWPVHQEEQQPLDQKHFESLWYWNLHQHL